MWNFYKTRVMKKSVFLIGVLLTVSLGAYAQSDDMYFTPTKISKVKKEQPLKVQEGTYDVSDDDVYSTEDYNGKKYSEAEVDAYNRRGYKVSKDTLYIGDGDKEANEYADRYAEEYNSNDYYYSNRLARFHEPAVNIYFGYGVPYWGWGYSYYDWAWDYNYAWNWGWNWGWNWYPGYYGWYGGWGWSYPWHHHYGWYDWGWSRPVGPGRPWHGSSWNGGRYLAGQTHYEKTGSAGGRIWAGGRNYRDAIERNGSSRSYSSNSRGINNNGRSYSTAGRNNMSARSYGSTRPSSSSTSTRSMSGSSSNSYSSGSSRSFGSSGSSMGSRSFGGGSGGGRSFGGGGGGRSFGGGRR